MTPEERVKAIDNYRAKHGGSVAAAAKACGTYTSGYYAAKKKLALLPASADSRLKRPYKRRIKAEPLPTSGKVTVLVFDSPEAARQFVTGM